MAIEDMGTPPTIESDSNIPSSPTTGHPRRATRSRSSSPPAKEEELWRGCHTIELPTNSNGGESGDRTSSTSVKIQWFEEKNQTIFARIEPSSPGANDVPVGQVLDAIVDDTWKRLAKKILENKKHIPKDAYPPASQLLQLGAVWLLNEKLYCQGHGAHAHRLHADEAGRQVDWADFTLRIHVAPERHFAADTVEWGKWCRGLLLDQDSVQVTIAGETPHLPILTEPGGALPDEKDGVIVYEDDDLGFAVLNKPANVPIHPSLSNHTEDVVSKFSDAIHKKKKQMHVSLPNRYPEIDTECSGLLAVATKSQFSAYLTHLLKQTEKEQAHAVAAAAEKDEQNKDKTKKEEPKDPSGLTKTYKCLVCVKNPDRMGLLEAFQKTGKLITHYCDPVHHHFFRNKPHDNDGTKWHKCQLRVKQVGDEKFRAACVQTVYQDSVDSCLAHRLWGPKVKSDVQFVMELQVETVGRFHAHQVRGQLAALGFPIVGDWQKGGGKISVFCERHEWKHMALQCCELSFPLPVVDEEAEKHEEEKRDDMKGDHDSNQHHNSSEHNHYKGGAHLKEGVGRCVFRLNSAWWSEYLRQYELYHEKR